MQNHKAMCNILKGNLKPVPRIYMHTNHCQQSCPQSYTPCGIHPNRCRILLSWTKVSNTCIVTVWSVKFGPVLFLWLISIYLLLTVNCLTPLWSRLRGRHWSQGKGTQQLFSVKYLFGQENFGYNFLLLEDGYKFLTLTTIMYNFRSSTNKFPNFHISLLRLGCFS